MPDVTAAPHRPLYGMTLRLLSGLGLTAMFATVKYLEEHGALLVETMFYRQLFALPAVLGAMLLATGRIDVATSRPSRHVLRAAIGLVGMALNFLAVTLLPLAESITITFTAPIFATILAAILLRETTGVHRWTAVMVGFVGVVAVANPTGGDLPLLGLAVAVAAAFSVGLISVILRDLARSEPASVIVFWFSALSLLPTGLAMLLFGRWPPAELLPLFVLLGLLGAISQILLTAALRWAPIAVVLPMDYSSILWASALGWLLWGTLPTVWSLWGAALIIGSGLYIVWREQRLGRAVSLAAKAGGDVAA